MGGETPRASIFCGVGFVIRKPPLRERRPCPCILAPVQFGDLAMSKPFTTITALIFFCGAAAHAYRLVTGSLAITVAGHDLPRWENWPAGIAALVFGVMLLRESRR
jgi:hypothetical protein